MINQSSGQLPKMLDVDDMNRIETYNKVRPVTVSQEDNDSMGIKQQKQKMMEQIDEDCEVV